MRRTISSALSALALIFVGVAPANADHGGTHAEDPWHVLDTNFAEGESGWTPNASQTEAEHSTLIDEFTVSLNQTGTELGTSIETSSLGVTVEAGAIVEVDYELSDDASAAANGVRMYFYFMHGGSPGDRPDTAPDHMAAAGADSTDGTLEIETGDGKIGYVGLVYDGGADGTVTFSNLRINDELVSFVPPSPPVTPEEPTSTDEQCDTPGTISVPDVEGVSYSVGHEGETEGVEPGTSHVTPGEYVMIASGQNIAKDATAEWTLTVAEATDCDEPTKDEDDESSTDDDERTATLPETGMSSAALAGLGLALLVAGGVLAFMGARQRRVAKYGRR